MKKPILFVALIYTCIVAVIVFAAFIFFSLFGCGELPQIQQTTTTQTKVIRLVQVDKDSTRKIFPDYKRVKIKQ